MSKCGVIKELGAEIIYGTDRKKELAETCIRHCSGCLCKVTRDYNISSVTDDGVLDSCCFKYGSKRNRCDENYEPADLTEPDNL